MRYASPCVPIVRIEMRAWAYGAYGAEHAMADAIECATCRCYYFVCAYSMMVLRMQHACKLEAAPRGHVAREMASTRWLLHVERNQ